MFIRSTPGDDLKAYLFLTVYKSVVSARPRIVETGLAKVYSLIPDKGLAMVFPNVILDSLTTSGSLRGRLFLGAPSEEQHLSLANW